MYTSIRKVVTKNKQRIFHIKFLLLSFWDESPIFLKESVYNGFYFFGAINT